MLRSILTVLAGFFIASAALADEVTVPPMGNTHLHLGGGGALLDTSNPNAVSINGARSSTFILNVNTNGITNVFTGFVDGQVADVYVVNVGTNPAATVTFSDTALKFSLPTNAPQNFVVRAAYVDGAYKTRNMAVPELRSLVITSNQPASWPSAPAYTNACDFVTSNNVLFVRTTTLNTATWGATNKIAP